MKFIDQFLRDWRIRKAMPFVRPNDSVLDIGCFDDSLFKKLKHKPISKSKGLDPLLTDILEKPNYRLMPGKFPASLKDSENFDCITLLAVLEHIPAKEQRQLNDSFYNYLKPLGRVIITVPSPFVDRILEVLSKLRLIDGMSLEEHYGFKVEETPNLFNSKQFKLIKHQKFQLGLNNLFVFERLQ